MSRTANIEIENAKIRFRNFSGKPDKYNSQGGKRTFCVFLDDPIARELEDEGWNIKYLNPRDPDEEPQAYLQVRVEFRNVPPKIWIVTSRNKTLMDEESVGSLDYVEIENCDVVISPYNWEVNGKTGITAYVKDMYVTIVEDRFADKYSNIGE